MKTTFRGVRTRYTETPLVDSDTLYMSMLGSLSDVDGSNYTIGDQKYNSTPNRSSNYAQTYGSFVTYDVQPNDGLKYQETNPNAKGDSYAMPQVGKFMQALALKWHEANKDLPNSDTLYVNNFGAHGGGTNKGHSSDKTLHAAGRAVDLRPMQTDKKVGKCLVGGSNYSQEKNKEFMQMAIDMSQANTYGVKIDNIILNDNSLISHFSRKGIKNSRGGQMVISSAGHDNHIHIEFEEPDEVAQKLNAAEQDENLVTAGVEGSVSTEKATIPSKEEKLKHLGKV